MILKTLRHHLQYVSLYYLGFAEKITDTPEKKGLVFIVFNYGFPEFTN